MFISCFFGDAAFFSYYVSLPFPFCMEITLYVFLSNSVFLSRDPGWVFTSSTREKSVNQSNRNYVNVIGSVLPAFCFLHTLLSLPPPPPPPPSVQSKPHPHERISFEERTHHPYKEMQANPQVRPATLPSRHGICSNIIVFGRRKVKIFVDQFALQLRCSRQRALCRGKRAGGW